MRKQARSYQQVIMMPTCGGSDEQLENEIRTPSATKTGMVTGLGLGLGLKYPKRKKPQR